MEIFENSLIEFFDENKKILSIERVLWISPDRQDCVVFELVEKDVGFPFVRSYSDILDAISRGSARKLSYDSYLKNKKESELSEKSKLLRDQAWEKIKELVFDEPDIYDEKLKTVMINELIEKKGYHKRVILKHLRRYWRGGKVKNALLPNFEKCGAPGENRESKTGIKRGRKPAVTQLNPDRVVGINVDEDTKMLFRMGFKLYYDNKLKNPMIHAYNETISNFFNIGYEMKNDLRIPVLPPQEELPSLGQFKYVYYKERKIKESLLAREGKRNFNLKHRPAIGNATRRAFGPGAIYEIDATIGDFQLVDSITRLPIGRPVIYYSKDVYSRLVAGLYIGLENISWLGAMVAIENATTDKVEFCSKYGIEISSDEWPSKYLPRSFSADRGEMESDNVDNLILNLGTPVQNMPPYRGDYKPFIEQHFRIANSKSKPLIPGYVEKETRERGERDSRLNAKLTIYEFTKIMILLTLEYNNLTLEEYPLERDMVASGIVPTPMNLWNWGIKHREVGLHEKPRDIIRANLMPQETATVTYDKGIFFNKWKIGYSCEKALSEGWYEKARSTGSWKIEISYDPRLSNHIYILDNNGMNFIKCDMLSQYDRFFNLSEEEILNLHLVERSQVYEYKDEENKVKNTYQTMIKKIIEDGIEKTNTIRDDGLSKKEILGGIKENRKEEKLKERTVSSWELDKQDTNKESEIIIFKNKKLDKSDASDEENAADDTYNLFNEQLNRRKNLE